MKTWIAITLLLCLLCGCCVQEVPSSPAVLTDTMPTTQPSTEEGVIFPEPESRPQTQPSAALPAEIPCSMVESDDSIRNDNGDVLVKILYQQIILDSSSQHTSSSRLSSRISSRISSQLSHRPSL